MRKLGKTQKAVLAALRQHGSWSLGCGWLWDTPSNTLRVMDSLVRAGYASVGPSKPTPGKRDVYRPIAKGLEVRPPIPTPGVRSVVFLSYGRLVNGHDVPGMLTRQHAILLKLSRALAEKGYGHDSVVQNAIDDANMLGLEVADRWKERED